MFLLKVIDGEKFPAEMWQSPVGSRNRGDSMEDHCWAGGSLLDSKSNQSLTRPVGQAKKEVSKGHLVQGLLSHTSDLGFCKVIKKMDLARLSWASGWCSLYLAILRVPCGALSLSEVRSDRILDMSSEAEFTVDFKVQSVGIFGDLCMGYKERGVKHVPTCVTWVSK